MSLWLAIARCSQLSGGFHAAIELLRAEHDGCSALQKDPVRRARWERALVQCQCQVFVASWTGVIRCCLTLLLYPGIADGRLVSLHPHEAWDLDTRPMAVHPVILLAATSKSHC